MSSECVDVEAEWVCFVHESLRFVVYVLGNREYGESATGCEVGMSAPCMRGIIGCYIELYECGQSVCVDQLSNLEWQKLKWELKSLGIDCPDC